MLRQSIPIFNYSISNKSGDELDVFIDGDIVDASTQEIMRNWWGDETSVSYRSFRNQIEEAKPKILNVYINTPGGHVGDAMAMHDYLNELETKNVTVNRRGRGIIASAGTYVLMGKNSEMSANSFMMIHNIQMVAVGDINEVENQVRAGRKFNDRIRDFYATSTGKPSETISAWMNKETWFNANEAKDNGFVSNITGDATFSNAIEADRFQFQNKAILNIYNSYTQQNQFGMNKIVEAIERGFSNALAKLGIKTETPEAQAVVDTFKNDLTAALADVPTNESIQQMITNSLAGYAKTEDVKPADVSNLATKDEIKNFVDKTFVNNAVATVKDEVIAAVADDAGSESNTDNPPKNKKAQRTFARNKSRFSGINYSEVTPQN